MLEIKNISKRFGGIQALDKCNLEIPRGKITAIIGPNGSGKSTLFNTISQLVDEDSGKIYLDKERIDNKKIFEISKKGISRTFQDVRLFKNMTIREHLEMALSDEEDEKIIKNFFSTWKKRDNQIKEVLKFVGLEKSLETLASDLSYGQRKLIDLAVAIAKPHKVLLLDEPVAGVNPMTKSDIRKMLKSLSKKGETILVIEHDMNFIMQIADSVYVLDEGKVIAHGKPSAIQKNKKVLEAYLGD